MEEETADVKPEEVVQDATEQVADEETVPVVQTVEDAETSEVDISNIARNEVAEEVLLTDVEPENEAGEEGDILDEMEEVPGMADKGEPKAEPEFVKKKKLERKIRRVDMDTYYPDESKSSIDENIVEKKAVVVEAEGITQDFDDSEDLIDPNKDYTVVDPSFLDEFLSSEEGQRSEVTKKEDLKKVEAFEEVEEEEDDFQQEIFVQPPDREPSDRVYDQICDLETPMSSDESFKVPRFRYIPRRRSYPTQGFRVEDNKWLPQTESVQSIEVPSTALRNLVENIAPALKKTLIEIGTYQPSNAVYYMTHSLLHKAKNPEEIGLEPDPNLIQLIVDGQKKKKKQQQIPILKKPDEIFLMPHAESHISTPPIEVKGDKEPMSDDDEDTSQLHKFQRKYRKAKKKIVTEEKAKRSNLDRKTMLPGTCLGPTSLPLSADVPSKVKEASSKIRL